MAAAGFHQQFNFKDHRSVCALPLLSPYLTPFSSVLSLSFMGSVCVLECVCVLSCVQLFCDPMDCQTSLSTGFSRQEYWSRLPFPSPGDLPDRGIEPMSPAVSGDSLPLHHLGSPCGFWLFLYPWEARARSTPPLTFSKTSLLKLQCFLPLNSLYRWNEFKLVLSLTRL